MKKTLFISIFAIIFNYCFGQKTDVMVDERTELMSIVFNLAGAEEYKELEITGYQKDIDVFFEKSRQHDLIKLTSKIKNKYGGFDRAMNFAIHTKIENGEILFIENVEDAVFDSFWEAPKGLSRKYLILLNDFYKKSNFHDFFEQHQTFYDIAKKNFSPLLNNIDYNWFNNFFGNEEEVDFDVILFFCNYGHNYGPKIKFKNGNEKLYSIIGVWDIDSLEHPVYPVNNLEIIIHEYCHSFCNPIIDAIYSKIKTNAEELFNLAKPAMEAQYYGSAKIMLYETFVRTAVIKYFHDHNTKSEEIINNIYYEKKIGFWLTDSLFSTLNNYSNNRNIYISFNNYKTEFIKTINNFSVEKLKQNSAKIIKTSIPNLSKNIDANIDQITLFFNKPMCHISNLKSRYYGFDIGKRGDKYYPSFIILWDNQAEWNEDNTAITIKGLDLKPNKKYSISFPATSYLGAGGEPILENYYLDFKTKK